MKKMENVEYDMKWVNKILEASDVNELLTIIRRIYRDGYVDGEMEYEMMKGNSVGENFD